MTDEEFFQQVAKIREIQTNDLRAALSVNADFLVALGCLNSVEFMGGALSGLLGRSEPKHMRSRLKAGLEFLGDPYLTHGFYALISIRNWLTHQYLSQARSTPRIAFVNDPRAPHPLRIDAEQTDLIVVNVSVFVTDVCEAWERLTPRLRKDKSLRAKAIEAFARLPILA